MSEPTSLEDSEIQDFEALIALLQGELSNLYQVALSRATFHGHEVAVIVAVSEDEDIEDSFSLRPLAILLNDDLFDDLIPPVEPDEIIKADR